MWRDLSSPLTVFVVSGTRRLERSFISMRAAEVVGCRTASASPLRVGQSMEGREARLGDKLLSVWRYTRQHLMLHTSIDVRRLQGRAAPSFKAGFRRNPPVGRAARTNSG